VNVAMKRATGTFAPSVWTVMHGGVASSSKPPFVTTASNVHCLEAMQIVVAIAVGEEGGMR
jgi:hypothetical protein